MRIAGMLLLLQLFFALTLLYAQPADTVSISRDSLQKIVRQTAQKEFARWKDSMEAVRIKQNVLRNGKPLAAFLQEGKEREQAHKRQLYFRIGLGLLFVVALATGLTRRRKRQW